MTPCVYSEIEVLWLVFNKNTHVNRWEQSAFTTFIFPVDDQLASLAASGDVVLSKWGSAVITPAGCLRIGGDFAKVKTLLARSTASWAAAMLATEMTQVTESEGTR
jgi:hypothetical protein